MNAAFIAVGLFAVAPGNALVTNGRSGDEAAAIVYDGTLPTQQTHAGSLQQMADLMKRSTDRRPGKIRMSHSSSITPTFN